MVGERLSLYTEESIGYVEEVSWLLRKGSLVQRELSSQFIAMTEGLFFEKNCFLTILPSQSRASVPPPFTQGRLGLKGPFHG